MGAFPDTISGFSVLPAIYSKDATHILYGKAHTTSRKTAQENKAAAAAAVAAADVLPKDRTLFLVNVPPDATQRELALFFKRDGLVEKVVFDQRAAEEEALNALNAVDESDSDGDEEEQEDGGGDGDGEGMEVDEEHARPAKKRKKEKNDNERRPLVTPLPSTPLRTLRHTGRTAFVVFLDASSLTTALSPPHSPRPWPAPQSAEPRGLAHYKALHSALRPPLAAVRAHAESAIALFDYQERQRRKNATSQYRKGEAVVDEDGFTLVARGGAYGQTLGGGVGVASKRFHDSGETSSRARGKKKQKTKGGAEKEGFYAFQKHEKKRRELIELKKKWKEDLEKVEKLKETKRYKPY